VGLTGKPATTRATKKKTCIGCGPRGQLPPQLRRRQPTTPLPAAPPAWRVCRLMPAELVSSPADSRRGSRDAAAGVTTAHGGVLPNIRIDCSGEKLSSVCGLEQEEPDFWTTGPIHFCEGKSLFRPLQLLNLLVFACTTIVVFSMQTCWLPFNERLSFVRASIQGPTQLTRPATARISGRQKMTLSVLYSDPSMRSASSTELHHATLVTWVLLLILLVAFSSPRLLSKN
jgi:hypothetical protein